MSHSRIYAALQSFITRANQIMFPIVRVSIEFLVPQNFTTALIRAATTGHADCMRVLLEAGADKEARDRVRCQCQCQCQWLGYVQIRN